MNQQDIKALQFEQAELIHSIQKRIIDANAAGSEHTVQILYMLLKFQLDAAECIPYFEYDKYQGIDIEEFTTRVKH